MMRIYVELIADLDQGLCSGTWINLEGKSSSEVQEEVDGWLCVLTNPVVDDLIANPEEANDGIAIADWEGLPHLLGDHTLDDVFAILDSLEDVEDGDAYLAYCEHLGHIADVDDFEENFLGEWDSELDYAYSYVDDTGMLNVVSDTVRQYFDYEAFARDLFMELSFHKGYVFS